MKAIEISGLSFGYGDRPVFGSLSFDIPAGARCLVLGANGVGKSTLLRLLAGKHMIHGGAIRVLGRDPFSGELGLADVSLVAEKFPFELDIEVAEILERARGRVAPELLEELLELLAVDPRWRMHRVSNGQRRRVDLLLTLIHQPRVLLLDEVTSDLDILGRQQLLRWLKKRTDEGRMSVILATHILDGMDRWASHVAFLSPGRLRHFGAPPKSPLLETCEAWLEEDARVARK
jgi:CCR4-NOT complex subunit CAF16